MGLCKDLGITQTELCTLLKPMYPRISRAAVSVAESPEESGVRFSALARKTAHKLLGKVERRPKRRHNNHLTIWVDDRQLRYLAKQPSSTGEYIRALIDREIKKAATSAATLMTAEILAIGDYNT